MRGVVSIDGDPISSIPDFTRAGGVRLGDQARALIDLSSWRRVSPANGTKAIRDPGRNLRKDVPARPRRI